LVSNSEPVALAVLADAVGTTPSTIRALADRGALEIRQLTEDRDPYQGREFPASAPLTLTPAQRSALEPIAASLAEHEHNVFPKSAKRSCWYRKSR
jgi:primosomal protein N' (replication factor Y)